MQTLHKDQQVILPDIVNRKRKSPIDDNDEICKKRISPKDYDQKEFNGFCEINLQKRSLAKETYRKCTLLK